MNSPTLPTFSNHAGSSVIDLIGVNVGEDQVTFLGDDCSLLEGGLLLPTHTVTLKSILTNMKFGTLRARLIKKPLVCQRVKHCRNARHMQWSSFDFDDEVARNSAIATNGPLKSILTSATVVDIGIRPPNFSLFIQKIRASWTPEPPRM